MRQKTLMKLQLTDDDAFVLASCMANQLAIKGAMIAPDETQILIAHLDRIEELNPTEKTTIFLARQDLIFGRYREAAVRICELLLGRVHRHPTGQITDP
jgi:hypothetical protein